MLSMGNEGLGPLKATKAAAVSTGSYATMARTVITPILTLTDEAGPPVIIIEVT